MKVKRLMHRELVTVSMTATVRDVAVKMKEQKVGSVLVVDEAGKLEGIVTDRDVAIAVAEALNPETACAYDIMTSDPIAIQGDIDIDSALRIMNRANVRRLPVCEQGKLVGLLSSADVATEIKDELNQFMGLEEAFVRH